MFFASDQVLDIMTLSIESPDLPATLAQIDQIWEKLVRQVPINRYFVGDRYDQLYESERRRSQIFSYFSVFAIFVACLGLLGLASFSAKQRTLEIGIRKVLGARSSHILSLVGFQFMKSVLLANVIAWPVVYLVMADWLSAYEHRVDINPMIFIISGLLAVLLAWVTVSWQVLKLRTPIPSMHSTMNKATCRLDR